jgi:hypothetical protein
VNKAYSDLNALYRQAQRQEAPTRADRHAVRAALLSAGTASVAAHAAAATGKLVAAIPGATKLFTLTQIVGLAGLGVALGTGTAVIGTAIQSKPAVTVGSKPVAVRATPAPKDQSQIWSEPAREPDPLPASSPHVSAHALPAPSQSQAASAASPLIEESRGLAEVQSALGAGDDDRALQLLAVQDRTFANGALGQERAAARVIALCAAGRVAEGQVAKARFLSGYPQSPLAKRVSGACQK